MFVDIFSSGPCGKFFEGEIAGLPGLATARKIICSAHPGLDPRFFGDIRDSDVSCICRLWRQSQVRGACSRWRAVSPSYASCRTCSFPSSPRLLRVWRPCCGGIGRRAESCKPSSASDWVPDCAETPPSDTADLASIEVIEHRLYRPVLATEFSVIFQILHLFIVLPMLSHHPQNLSWENSSKLPRRTGFNGTWILLSPWLLLLRLPVLLG